MESPETSSPIAAGTLASAGRRCLRVGCDRPLTGRQTKFCSRLCNSAWDSVLHPRINRTPEGPRTAPLWKLILGLLGDGKRHSAHDIALKLHADKHSVVSRISELIARGHDIRTDLPKGSSRRFHTYWLVTREAA